MADATTQKVGKRLGGPFSICIKAFTQEEAYGAHKFGDI